MKRRIEIMAKILAFCIRARRKIHVMYGANLSHAQLKTYLTFLTSRDLLAHNSHRHVTTEKGHRFLEASVFLNDVLRNRAHRAFLEIISENYNEAEITQWG